jgi:NAD(P)-dependent dehydrogenase (short-subunit alcohol dehydrogenase family)
MFRARPKDGIAFVTGASSGIGRAVTVELVRRGYQVAVTARRSEELTAFAASHPEQVFAFPGDVTDPESMNSLIAAIETAHGPIALAFLNAGVSFLGEERRGFDVETVWRTQVVNIGGTVNCLAPLLARMGARGAGQIAINASLAGYCGMPGSPAYGASKAALINMAESLALSGRAEGVTIQIICHGFVRTPMTGQEKAFAMPFLIEADDAARRICDGFERAGFEISFPWQLAVSLKLLRLLPYGLRFSLLAFSLHRAKQGKMNPAKSRVHKD